MSATKTFPIRPLSPIEVEAHRGMLEASQATAPGHLVIGPYGAPPFWRCPTCGAAWSNGPHPRPRQGTLPTGTDGQALPRWADW